MNVSVLLLLVLFSSFSTFPPVFTALRHSLLCNRCITYGRVRPSVTRWYCVEMNEATIVQFSLSGSTIILVSGEVKIVDYVNVVEDTRILSATEM